MPSRAQPREHAQRARRVAGEQRLAELEDIEARAVGDAREHRLRADPRPARQERELAELLLCGEQVALGARR